MQTLSVAKSAAINRLSDRVRTARQAAQMSQAKIASLINVTAGAVAQWEQPRGTKPTLGRLQAIAEITNVSFTWLATGHGTASPTKVSAGARDTVDTVYFAHDQLEESLLTEFRALTVRNRELVLSLVTELAGRRRRR
jgi:transcriptional regulator with XRE-family HTH domain